MPFEWWKTLLNEVSVNGENCLRNYNNTGCKKCVKACTNKAISPNTDGIELDHGKCNLCGACSAACPTEAIPVSFEPYGFLKERDFIYLCPKSLGQDYSCCLGWMSTEHILDQALQSGQPALTEFQAKQVLSHYQIPVVTEWVATNWIAGT